MGVLVFEKDTRRVGSVRYLSTVWKSVFCVDGKGVGVSALLQPRGG